MIVVRVELHSAITHRVTELARMHICNNGGTNTLGDYICTALRGRSKEALDKRTPQRCAMVTKHQRLTQHVWNLVAKALTAMEYGHD